MIGLFTLLILVLALHSFSADQLAIDSSFLCPVTNPSCFKYYNDNFYITKSDEARIFIVNRSMECIDTITTPLSRIDAIAIHDDFLWVIPDSFIYKREVNKPAPISDTMPYLDVYKRYSIYKIDPASGVIKVIKDSVVFEISIENSEDKDFILGLEEYNDKFIVAFNGGFGPSVLFVEKKEPHRVRDVCCVHPMGMVRIGNEILAVRIGGKALTKLDPDSENLENSIDYTLSFLATDIAYDGDNIWLCDSSNSMLHKMKSLPSSSVLFPANKSRLSSVHSPNITKPVILNGRISRYRDNNASQIMILIQENKATKRNIIDCNKTVKKRK